MTTRHHTRIIKNRAIKRWIGGRQKLADPQQLTISLVLPALTYLLRLTQTQKWSRT
jgi:hypothetical protein